MVTTTPTTTSTATTPATTPIKETQEFKDKRNLLLSTLNNRKWFF
jgi:hypothetical protein